MSKITTKENVRLSYTNLITPRPRDDEHKDELLYSTAILIPKSNTVLVKAIKDAIAEALAEGVSKKWGGKRPNGLKNPLRDGDADRPDDEVYAGHYFINAKGPRGGKEQPILLDKDGNATDSFNDIYSGVEARVSIQFYPYDNSGNKGVACGVTSVLSSGVGEALGAPPLTVAGALDEFGVSTPVSAAADEFAGKETVSETAADADDDPWSS